MKYIEPPEEYDGKGKSLFLSGTIRGAPDWQSEVVGLLKNEDLVLLNPRRKDFNASDPNAGEVQVRWEHEHLRKATAISFWFSKEPALTMTLYELGAWSMTEKPIFVGVDPEYARRKDVEMQTRAARPDVKIVYSLETLVGLIKEWAKK